MNTLVEMTETVIACLFCCSSDGSEKDVKSLQDMLLAEPELSRLGRQDKSPYHYRVFRLELHLLNSSYSIIHCLNNFCRVTRCQYAR